MNNSKNIHFAAIFPDMLRVDLIAAIKVAADPDRRIHPEISQILNDLTDDADKQCHGHDRRGRTEFLADALIFKYTVAFHAADIQHDITDIFEQLAGAKPSQRSISCEYRTLGKI